MKNKANQITVYAGSEFMGNIIKYEGTLIEHGTRKYAQYDNAPFVTFIQSGKRKPVQILKGFQPSILILEGTGHPEPEGVYGEPKVSGGAIIRESRYASFDERFDTDFDAMIDRYIEEVGINVVADYRHTKGFNSHSAAMSKSEMAKRQTYGDYVAELRAKGLNEEQVKEAVKMSSI